MKTFTTEQRRKMTSSIISTEKEISNQLASDSKFDVAIAEKTKEDESNREMFLSLNSELTGLLVEYRYMAGIEKPCLHEEEYSYYEENVIDEENGTIEIVDVTYYDSAKLRSAASFPTT